MPVVKELVLTPNREEIDRLQVHIARCKMDINTTEETLEKLKAFSIGEDSVREIIEEYQDEDIYDLLKHALVQDAINSGLFRYRSARAERQRCRTEIRDAELRLAQLQTEQMEITSKDIRKQLKRNPFVHRGSIRLIESTNRYGETKQWLKFATVDGIECRPHGFRYPENQYRWADNGKPRVFLPRMMVWLLLSNPGECIIKPYSPSDLTDHGSRYVSYVRHFYTPHPHVLTDNRPCWGDFGANITEAVQNGDLRTAVDTIVAFFQQAYDFDGAGQNWVRYYAGQAMRQRSALFERWGLPEASIWARSPAVTEVTIGNNTQRRIRAELPDYTEVFLAFAHDENNECHVWQIDKYGKPTEDIPEPVRHLVDAPEPEPEPELELEPEPEPEPQRLYSTTTTYVSLPESRQWLLNCDSMSWSMNRPSAENRVVHAECRDPYGAPRDQNPQIWFINTAVRFPETIFVLELPAETMSYLPHRPQFHDQWVPISEGRIVNMNEFVMARAQMNPQNGRYLGEVETADDLDRVLNQGEAAYGTSTLRIPTY